MVSAADYLVYTLIFARYVMKFWNITEIMYSVYT